jgi:hypothetical protein
MSNKRVWWICDKGHEWNYKVYARAKGNRCKVCFPRKPKQEVSNIYNLKVINPELLNEWHPTKNAMPVTQVPFMNSAFYII